MDGPDVDAEGGSRFSGMISVVSRYAENWAQFNYTDGKLTFDTRRLVELKVTTPKTVSPSR